MNEKKKADKALSFTKKLILFILIMAEIEIVCSYVLAFMGMPEIAQELSARIVTTIIGGIGFYTIKSLIENLSKYGSLFGVNNSETVIDEDEAPAEPPPDTADEFIAENNVGIEDIV